ncbi:hypothetical protein [Euzebya tangerina]|uniref:hypothetical protein n=1 Tax=Euzebya tangerina TaxID=591198 RepID=UPI000E31D448|nr:hypothetical protein [Euzebya tangerina]
MSAELHVILDDREVPPPEVRRLVGDIHFGDLLRRRQRYRDEVTAAAASADEVTVLRSDEDADRLIRRIESARGGTSWLRLPLVAAPLDVSRLDFLIKKMRYAVEPTFLAPLLDDDAPMVLPARDMVALLATRDRRERRSEVLRLAETSPTASHDVTFVDLRRPEALRAFLAGATEPRASNRLTVDAGILVKRSQDVAKMRAEHGFFTLAPPRMRRFLLPTFDFEESSGTASYRMEYVRVPDAALQFVLGRLSEDAFDQLLDQFFDYLDSRDADVVGRPAVRDAGRNQILDKMHRRLGDFFEMPEAAQLESVLAVAGVPGGLSSLADRATRLVESALDDSYADRLTFSHGDPCLSNILFEERIGLMRLIDPRGAVVREDALLHPLYDLAKFSHSVCGGYDFVNNGLYSVEVDDGLGLDLQLHRGGPPPWMHKAYRARLDRHGWDYDQVRAVEASLFLSMLPLHREHPRKLLGYVLIARDILQELEGHAVTRGHR